MNGPIRIYGSKISFQMILLQQKGNIKNIFCSQKPLVFKLGLISDDMFGRLQGPGQMSHIMVIET